MKLRLAIATTLAATLWPMAVFAADQTAAGTSWYPLIFYAVNFAVFIWLVAHYGGQSIQKFFKDRAGNIRETMSRAERSFKEAEELAKRAADRLSKLEDEKRQITSDLADETVYQVQRIYELGQESVARIQRDTALTSAALSEAAQRRLRESLAESAGRVAREMLAASFRPADQQRMLESFVERLREEAR